MLRIDSLKIYSDLTEEEVISKAIKKYSISKEDIISINIIKKSIDARDKNNIHYNYSFNIEVKDDKKYPKIKSIIKEEEKKLTPNRKSTYRPIIIGAGPAGLFCALKLVEYGYKPIIILKYFIVLTVRVYLIIT